MLHLRHGGVTGDRDLTQGTVTEIWTGSKDEVIKRHYAMRIGMRDVSGYCSYVGSRYHQADGPFWELEINYRNATDSSGNTILDAARPTDHELQWSVGEVGIETCPKYLTCWNYWLMSLGQRPLPGWWGVVVDGVIPWPDCLYYAWTKNPEAAVALAPVGGVYWRILAGPVKRGVQARVVPSYTIVETALHPSEERAAWAAVEGGKFGYPWLGTFHIGWGDWLNFGGTIKRYGRRGWQSSVTYKHSPDGWDPDMYEGFGGGVET